METMYFVLGMLSIIGAIILATIVWGVLKITNLLKAIKQHEEWIINNDRNVYDNSHRLREDLERRMDNMDRYANQYVTELQREIDTRFNNFEREVDMRFDDQLDAVAESHAYTDKRIDKLIDAYFNDIKQTEKKHK